MDTIHPMYFQHRLVKYHVDIEFQVLQRLHVSDIKKEKENKIQQICK